MGVNRRYKDSVFSFLFSNPVVLRELYEALEGVTLPPDTPLTINTLSDVLFLDRINDISFEVGGKMVVLIEHQSTINPNMALRLLLYIARLYEKIIGDKNIYASKPLKIPHPEFFVLYNGTAPYPDEQILRLSDSFEKFEEFGIDEKIPPNLELVVKVLNINVGRNESIVKKSKTLMGYSVFIGKIREYEQEYQDKEKAIKKAVHYCREHDILKGFLEQNASEVFNMLITEWNWDDALAVRFKEGWEKGEAKRQIEIAQNALEEGASPEFVQKITGLDFETVKSLYDQGIRPGRN